MLLKWPKARKNRSLPSLRKTEATLLYNFNSKNSPIQQWTAGLCFGVFIDSLDNSCALSFNCNIGEGIQMHKSIAALCDVLDSASDTVLGVQSDNRRVPDLTGTWHIAALNREQLADIPADISTRLRAEDVDDLSSINIKKIDALSESVKALSTTIIPNLFNGNAIHSVDPYLNTFQYVSFVLDSSFGWRSLPAKSTMPAGLLRKLQSLENQLQNLEVNTGRVQTQLIAINEAYEAAENLPTTTAELKTLIGTVGDNVAGSEKLLSESKNNFDLVSQGSTSMKALMVEAEKVVAKCQDAYRIATTTGLAGAFDSRAKSLSNSMWVWVSGLLAALIIGGIVGYFRFLALTDSFKIPTAGSRELIVQGLLSLVSLGAPIWFAWLSTKQIGQRFRLSEDYAFKATLAKAYEGYRREAERLDENLEKRLFSSALDRLEEPPLRLVEIESHGSPFHEFKLAKKFANPLKKADRKVNASGAQELPKDSNKVD
jgi:chaperonin cofactor prefoldin